MKNPFGNMSNILKQAQAMQEQMAKIQEQAASKTVSGTAGGGIVTVTANGAMQVVSVAIPRSSRAAMSICYRIWWWPRRMRLCGKPRN
jgi:DNA-binding YbaB/EbfC family protein